MNVTTRLFKKMILGLVILCGFYLLANVIPSYVGNNDAQTAYAQRLQDPAQGMPQLQNNTNIKNVKDVANSAVKVINILVVFVIGLGFFFFIYGLVKYSAAGGDSDQISEARDYIIYGVIGIAVMVSVWGLVRIVVNTFFPSTGSNFVVPQFK